MKASIIRVVFGAALALMLSAACGTADRTGGSPAANSSGGGVALGSDVSTILFAALPNCFFRALSVDHDSASSDYGRLPCSFVEATPKTPNCSCDTAAVRSSPDASIQAGIRRHLYLSHNCSNLDGADCKAWCQCEIEQFGNDALRACEHDPNPDPSLNGFCYVEPPTFGDASVIPHCDAGDNLLRFLGRAMPRTSNDTRLFLACHGKVYADGGD